MIQVRISGSALRMQNFTLPSTWNFGCAVSKQVRDFIYISMKGVCQKNCDILKNPTDALTVDLS